MPNEQFVEIGRTMEESKEQLNIARWYMTRLTATTALMMLGIGLILRLYARNCNLEDVSHIRKLLIFCLCWSHDPEVAEAIKEGKIDAMGVARQFLDPNG